MNNVKLALLKLENNPKDIYDETRRLLIKIADNVLKEPTNLKIRSLQKNNHTISKKILGVTGGLDCLKAMGFEENENSLILPPGASLNNLQLIRNEISNYRDEHLNNLQNLEENAFAGLVTSENAAVSSTESSSSDDDNTLSDDNFSSDNNISNSKQCGLGAIPKVMQQQNEKRSSININKIPSVPHDVPKVNLPPLNYVFANQFLREIELAFHMALSYDDTDLLKRAKALIPQEMLQLNAQKRLRILQEQIKKGNMDDPNISIQDMLILELLNWFKNDFFQWVDSPDCEFCGGKSSFSHMSSDHALQIHTQRIEMHKCAECQHLTPFPRYNDVNILLITRRGRCGEWANTFTVMCRAMEWDARHVADQTDHVWTEVYSFGQKRWLHCDPCENICDTPLMYENGWGKKLSYVIAYSHEEVQDVTWRYSSHHKELLSRRIRCAEYELIDALIKLREMRQKTMSAARKDYLTKQILNELVELMVEKTPTENDKQSRNSGSLAWRLARGEIQENVTSSYCWTFSKEDMDSSSITVRYSIVSDQYQYILANDGEKFIVQSWQAGAFNVTDVFRKEERDWKMVYIARKEGTSHGSISWKFLCGSLNKVIDTVSIKFYHQVFENGKISVQLTGEDYSYILPESTMETKIDTFSGCKSILITAQLSGGKGDIAWQHAQLFRQSTSSKECPFFVSFTFKSSS